MPGFGVQRQQGVDGLDLDSVPGPSDAGGHLPGFGSDFSSWATQHSICFDASVSAGPPWRGSLDCGLD